MWLLLHFVFQLALYTLIRGFTILITKSNPGSMFEFHLYDHNVGLITEPIAMSTVIAGLIIAAFIFHGWKKKPFLLKCGVIVIIPLIIVMFFFGWIDELRDYYEAVPFLLPLFWISFARWLESF